MEIPEYLKNVRKMMWTIIGALGALATIWGVTDRLTTDAELKASEDRIIAEVRTESADIRAVIIEDMESRLDALIFDINMAEARGDAPNEADIIKRNNLERRINKLKAEETNEEIN